MRTGIALFFFYKVSLMKHPSDDGKTETINETKFLLLHCAVCSLSTVGGGTFGDYSESSLQIGSGPTTAADLTRPHIVKSQL